MLSAAGVPLLAMHFGARGALVGYAGASLLPAVRAISLFGLRPFMPRHSVWPYALASWAAALLSVITWSRSELFFLDRLRGPAEAAMFGAGLTLAGLATQVPLLFCGALMPHFAELHSRDDIDALRRAYGRTTELLAVVVMPAAALTSALSPVLIPLLYGPQFGPAVPSAAITIAGASLAFASAGSAYVNGLGKSSFIAMSAGLGAIAVIGALLYAVPARGATGAACARVAVQFSMVALGCWYIASRLRTPVPVARLAMTAACSASAGLCAAAVVVRLNSIAGLGLAALVFAVVYAVGVGVTGLLEPIRSVAPLRRLLRPAI